MMQSDSSNRLRRRAIRRQSQRSTKNEWVNMARLFTFLDYDGVPWNNNNAEHAIKGLQGFADLLTAGPRIRSGSTW